MKLKLIKDFVTSKIGRQILVAQKHSPTILFGAGVVGVVTAAVIASRATLKLESVLDEAQEMLEKARTLEDSRYSEEDRKRDIVIIYGKTTVKIARMYIPAVLIGSLAITALTGSHVILSRRNLAVTAAYAALDRGFREYRQRVVDELGIDKDREFRYDMKDREIVEETETGPQTKVIKTVGPKGASVYARFFDEYSSNWNRMPSYNQMFLQCQQNYANDLLRANGHVFLNEVYDMLGLSRTREGSVVGWILDGSGDGYIDFGVFQGDRHSGMRFVTGQEPSILLDFNVDGVIWNLI